MFPDYQAEILKEDAGQKYRPSNGTEGDLFMSEYCWRCQLETHCTIPGKTALYQIEADDYPAQWQIGSDGQPTCTEFLKRKDSF